MAAYKISKRKLKIFPTFCQMAWISRKEYDATEIIVSQCRMYLSKRQLHRLKTDLAAIHNVKTRLIDSFQIRQTAAAIMIQKTFRSHVVRKFLKDHVDDVVEDYDDDDDDDDAVLTACQYAHSNDMKRRIYTREADIKQLEETKELLDYLVHLHLKDLDDLSLWCKSRIQKVLLVEDNVTTPPPSPNHDTTSQNKSDKQTRLKGKKDNYEQILLAVGNQGAFVRKLQAQSLAMSEKGKQTLDLIQQNYNSIQNIHSFLKGVVVNGSDKIESQAHLEWIYNEEEWMMTCMGSCDECQEQILFEEQIRMDENIQTLLQSHQMFSSKVALLQKLEGYEAEAFSLTLTVESRLMDSSDGEKIMSWIQSNGEKIEQVENSLVNEFDSVHSFYFQQEDLMAKSVVFAMSEFKVEATCKRSNKSCIGRFMTQDWMQLYNKKPWIQKEEMDAASKHLKLVQQHIRIRRNDLIRKKQIGGKCGDTNNHDLDKGMSSRQRRASQAKLLFSAGTTFVTKAKHNLNGLKHELREANKVVLRSFSLVKAKIKGRVRVVPLRIPSRRDHELDKMVANVKRYMQQLQNNCVAVSALKITFGAEESESLEKVNNNNASNGRPFYQNRLEIGHHTQVLIWIEYSSKAEQCITHIALSEDDEAKEYRNEGYTLVGHPNLSGGLWIKRDPHHKLVVASMQVAFSNNSDSHILKKDYEKIPCCLTVFGDRIARGNIWIALKNRNTRNTPIDICKLEKELEEYETLLSEHPEDEIVQSLVNEMARRVEVGKRKEVERQKNDSDLDYITEFLVIDQNDVDKLRKVFNAIDHEGHKRVSTKDILHFMDAPSALCGIIQQFLGLLLDKKSRALRELDFSQFSKGLSQIIMLGKDEMIKLIFSSIDQQGYGHIPRGKFLGLLDIMDPNGKDVASRRLREENLPDSLSFALFEAISEKYPSLFSPLFQFQRKLRGEMLGAKYWNRKIRKFQLAKKIAST